MLVAPLAARAIGSYARGCLAGAVALPINGPDWQVMRLSRNRNWGHPRLIDFLERFAADARNLDGWPGLLVGNMSQPRGGPMVTSHSSHQIGLDVDIWLTPMPDQKKAAIAGAGQPATGVPRKSSLTMSKLPQECGTVLTAGGFKPPIPVNADNLPQPVLKALGSKETGPPPPKLDAAARRALLASSSGMPLPERNPRR